ncbi:oligosaccharide flippase family protein [Marinobacterium sp. YM272]|uniref:oligosaccharide flippase family protein n=1 Tax=Marinobacterium sp. YM272 TaxID=3421654 RepID=UPI003D7FCD97
MRDYLLMGVVTAARISVALGTLLILARVLGPNKFGFISVVVTWSAIAALVTDYGFNMQAIRDIGANNERAVNVMSSSLAGKTILVSITTCIFIPLILLVSGLSDIERVVAALFFFGTLAGSYGDLALVAFRGLREYKSEAEVVVIAAFLHFIILLVVVFLSDDLILIAFAFILSRLLYAILAVISLVRRFSKDKIFFFNLSTVMHRFRSSLSFAVDSGATNIFSQLDVILINHLAGREMAGIYFAGARLLQGAVPFSVLLASIHIPRCAKLGYDKSARLKGYGLRIFLEYIVVGVFFGFAFFILGPIITNWFLGPDYKLLNSLWLAFGVFTAIRFAAAGIGVQLVALGTGFIRTSGIILSGVITIVLYWIYIPDKGIVAAPWVSAFGMTFITIFYAVVIMKIYGKMKAEV